MNDSLKVLLSFALSATAACTTTTENATDGMVPLDGTVTDVYEDGSSRTESDTQDIDGVEETVEEDLVYEPEAGMTGWPCLSEDECDSGFCLLADGSEEGYCSDICQQECPPGYLCKNQPQYGPVVFLCVAIEEVGCIKQCTTPNTFKGCGVPGALCATVDGLNFCLEACADSSDCKDGFSCLDFEDDGGFVLGKQCVPDSGSCVCGLDTDFTSDPSHCGSCGEACSYPNAEALCTEGECTMGNCLTGFSDINDDPSDGCEVPCDFLSEEDYPDSKGIDANCDGIDGVLDRAVFVATDGSDIGNDDGSMDDPFLTIGAAIDFAAGMNPKGMVLVSAGTSVSYTHLTLPTIYSV